MLSRNILDKINAKEAAKKTGIPIFVLERVKKWRSSAPLYDDEILRLSNYLNLPAEKIGLKSYFDVNLPRYVQKDINRLKKAYREKKCLMIDCYMDELYGSLNSAQYDNEIPKEQADYLRKKYMLV